MSKVEQYIREAVSIANDNSHGYSQANRNGNPDYDCSSLVCRVVQSAGIPVMDYGATYTGNMRPAFILAGFRDVTNQVDLNTCAGMEPGDVLLRDDTPSNAQDHTAIYIGNRQLVHARGSEGNTIPGDQSGNEIRVQGYFNCPWSVVLRYMEKTNMTKPETPQNNTEKIIWNKLKDFLGNDYGVAGLMGNLYAESGLRTNNLEDTANARKGISDEAYTDAVNNGSYSEDSFALDAAGYGLAQWTYTSRKRNLYRMAKSYGRRIDDLELQLTYLCHELQDDFPDVLHTLMNAWSIREASNAVLFQFENPADQSVAVQNQRESYGKVYYDKYVVGAEFNFVPDEPDGPPVLAGNNNRYYPDIICFGDTGYEVKKLQAALNTIGYNCGEVDGEFGNNTLAAVLEFQKKNRLAADGEVGPMTRAAIEEKYAEVEDKSIGVVTLGQIVEFTGGKARLTSNSEYGRNYEAGRAKITAVRLGEKYPYHLAPAMGGSSVYGWVKSEQIKVV